MTSVRAGCHCEGSGQWPSWSRRCDREGAVGDPHSVRGATAGHASPLSSTYTHCHAVTDAFACVFAVIPVYQKNDENGNCSGEGIEFPTTNLYELESRVLTDHWSIPYKREESLGKCLLASTYLARLGKLSPRRPQEEGVGGWIDTRPGLNPPSCPCPSG